MYSKNLKIFLVFIYVIVSITSFPITDQEILAEIEIESNIEMQIQPFANSKINGSEFYKLFENVTPANLAISTSIKQFNYQEFSKIMDEIQRESNVPMKNQPLITSSFNAQELYKLYENM